MNDLVSQVRREVADHFGFAHRQVHQLVGMCGEVASRVTEALAESGRACTPVHLRLESRAGEGLAHKVVVADGLIVDGTVTQFVSGGFEAFRVADIPDETFCFAAGPVRRMVPDIQEAPDAPPYPAGRIVAARVHEFSRRELYASRAYMLHAYPTRFSCDDDVGTLRPFERAYATGDVDWRRTSSAGLECFLDAPSTDVDRFAAMLLDDADELVREIAASFRRHGKTPRNG